MAASRPDHKKATGVWVHVFIISQLHEPMSIFLYKIVCSHVTVLENLAGAHWDMEKYRHSTDWGYALVHGRVRSLSSQ